MLPVVDILILSLLLGKHMSYSQVYLAPSFFPFCQETSYCHEDCLCETYQNCSVLLMDHSIRSSMLYYHNQIREQMSLYQPQPSGMTILKYDQSLEQISACWASKCINEYSDCFLTQNYSSTSQSVIQVILETGQAPELITWMQELNNMVRDLETAKIRRYSHNLAQIVSDRILSVGCAWSVSSSNRLTFVCTYGPSGGKEEDLVYKTGTVCSMCPEQYACNNMEPFPKLCKPISKQSKSQKEMQFTSSQEEMESTSPQEEMESTSQEIMESTSTPTTVQSTEALELPTHHHLVPPLLPPLPPTLTESTLPESTTLPGSTTSLESTLPDDQAKRSGEENDKKEKPSKKDGLIVGVMVVLLILALISAISSVCIFTHGFGCNRYK